MRAHAWERIQDLLWLQLLGGLLICVLVLQINQLATLLATVAIIWKKEKKTFSKRHQGTTRKEKNIHVVARILDLLNSPVLQLLAPHGTLLNSAKLFGRNKTAQQKKTCQKTFFDKWKNNARTCWWPTSWAWAAWIILWYCLKYLLFLSGHLPVRLECRPSLVESCSTTAKTKIRKKRCATKPPATCLLQFLCLYFDLLLNVSILLFLQRHFFLLLCELSSQSFLLDLRDEAKEKRIQKTGQQITWAKKNSPVITTTLPTHNRQEGNE